MKTKNRIVPFVTGAFRFLLGLVFVFSGFVKAVDPVGMAYKLDAYLDYFGIVLPSDVFTLLFAVALAVVEFLIGIFLWLGMRVRFTLVTAFLFMLLMTGVTVFIYKYNPVHDCGCFGDVLTLSNGETLAKNIVLLIMAFWLLCFCRKPSRLISERSQWVISSYSLIFILIANVYSIRFLPPIDFLPYKIGVHIDEEMLGLYKTTFLYEKDGERQEFGGDSLPDETWTLLDVKTEELIKPTIPNFHLLRGEEDVTFDILTDTAPTFLFTFPDLFFADDACGDMVNDIVDFCSDNNYRFYALVPSEQIGLFEDWTDRTGATYSVLTSARDDIRSMVRSNPGLMLLKEGMVVDKWSNKNLPDFADEGLHFELLNSEEVVKQSFMGIVFGSFLWFVLPLLLLMIFDKLWGRKIMKKLNAINNNLNRKTMRKKIVAGNWKMNLNLQEGKALASELKAALAADAPNCDVVICTPFIHLAPVAEIVEGSVIGLGAENCADKVSGAYTGEVSAEMVKSTGAQYVILGHSERRAYYGETEAILKEKTKLALANGLKVIFCIGEVLEERESGRQNEVVKAQLEGSLFELTAEELKNVILAYEPVWAIGTGKTATAEQAEDMHAFIRGVMAEKWGAEAADELSILYGGSCKPSNAKEIFAKANVDGGLIGGAALKVADFKGIIDAWK